VEKTRRCFYCEKRILILRLFVDAFFSLIVNWQIWRAVIQLIDQDSDDFAKQAHPSGRVVMNGTKAMGSCLWRSCRGTISTSVLRKSVFGIENQVMWDCRAFTRRWLSSAISIRKYPEDIGTEHSAQLIWRDPRAGSANCHWDEKIMTLGSPKHPGNFGPDRDYLGPRVFVCPGDDAGSWWVQNSTNCMNRCRYDRYKHVRNWDESKVVAIYWDPVLLTSIIRWCIPSSALRAYIPLAGMCVISNDTA